MNQRSSPLRTVFISLSQTPPALMLLIIIGLAVLVTMMVTGSMAQTEERNSLLNDSSSGNAPVIESTMTIPAGSTITKMMVSQRRVSENNIWQDSITTMPTALGRVAKNTIPAKNQIRETDLN